MKKIDFSKYKKKYTNLDEKDISLLNNIFNQEDIFNKLSDFEEKRKKGFYNGIIIGVILTFVSCLIFFLLFSLGGILMGLIAGLVLSAGVFFFYFYSPLKSNFKKELVSKFVTSMYENMSYNYDNSLFPESVSKIKEKTGLLGSYDRISLFEDSLKYSFGYDDKNSIEIFGVEIKTEYKSKNNEGNTSYNTEDHCYITKIKFLEPRFQFDNYVKIEGVERGFSYYLLSSFIPGLIIFLIIAAFINYIGIGGFDLIYYILMFFLIFGSVHYIRIYYENKNRVKLENSNFENKFNVYSKDELTSRQILTQSFMSKIFEYRKLVGKKVSFYFENDEIYIKHRLGKTFLEFNLFKSLFKNLENYIKFYLHIKQTKNLVEKLGLYYYDELSFSNIDFSDK